MCHPTKFDVCWLVLWGKRYSQDLNMYTYNIPTHTHASHTTAHSYLLYLQGKQPTDCGKQSRTIPRGVFQ